MTRDQAKVYAKLSKEDLELINKEYAERYQLICDFANGAILEFKYGGKWFETSNPDLSACHMLRVKHPAKVCESLDKKELSCNEKKLIRLLRNAKIEDIVLFYSVFNKQGGGISFKVDDEKEREEFYRTLIALTENKPYLPVLG